MDSWYMPLVPCSTHCSSVSLGVPYGTMSIPVAAPWSRDVYHPGSQDPHLSYLWSHGQIQGSIHQPLPSCAVPSLCTALRCMYYDGAYSYTLHVLCVYHLQTSGPPIRGKLPGSMTRRPPISCLRVSEPLDLWTSHLGTSRS